MKKVLAVVAAVGCLAAATVSFAGIGAGTGVNGSLHDMTRVVPATADAMGRVCVYCHAPHHAIVTGGTGDALPLWNHVIVNDTFTAYTWATPGNLYTGPEGAAVPITDPLAGPSRLCMSCHDGVTAIDEHGTTMNGTFKQNGGTTLRTYVSDTHDGGQRSNLGGASGRDVSQTHPIGFDYNEIARIRNLTAVNGSGSAGTEIVDSSFGYATGITIHNDQDQGYNAVQRASTGKKIADNLFEGKIMTCATCHDVHNKENATQVPYNTPIWDGQPGTPKGDTSVLGVDQNAPNYFLYAKQYQSLICLSCHVK